MWPGLLDCLATGGMAAGEMLLKAARKEATNKTGISTALAKGIHPPVGQCLLHTAYAQAQHAEHL
jgi:hypothetical protein